MPSSEISAHNNVAASLARIGVSSYSQFRFERPYHFRRYRKIFSALPSVTNRMMSMTMMLNVAMVLVMSMIRTASIVTFSALSQR
jgi:hypothetical protein